MGQVILIVISMILFASLLALFASLIMAPFSANPEWLESKGYGKMEILQIPNLYLKRYYKPNKIYVQKMAVFGTSGLALGFTVLLIMKEFGFLSNTYQTNQLPPASWLGPLLRCFFCVSSLS